MTVKEISQKCGLTLVVSGDTQREISGVYCCDLLSVVMSKGFENCAWVTIMNNLNSVAVSSLIDMSCIVLADDVVPDEMLVTKATQQGINILLSKQPIFETALCINNAISGEK